MGLAKCHHACVRPIRGTSRSVRCHSLHEALRKMRPVGPAPPNSSPFCLLMRHPPMVIEVSSLAQRLYRDVPNEDVVGHAFAGETLLAWIVDGASTITEKPFTTFSGITDATWFAEMLGNGFTSTMKRSRIVDTRRISEILLDAQEMYRRAGGFRRPPWAWPSAAAMIVCITCTNHNARISVLRYADCAFEFAPINPKKSARATGSVPVNESIDEPWQPFSGVAIPALRHIKERRTARQLLDPGGVLTLAPESAFGGTAEFKLLPVDTSILICSDGLSRLWKSYNLMTSRTAVEIATNYGLSALITIIRNHERHMINGTTEIKRSDDISALLISLQGSQPAAEQSSHDSRK